MSFKPVVKEKEINGITFKAQFNGISAMLEATEIVGDSEKLSSEYLFENVLVEPKISNIDEYFGTDIDFYKEVVAFAGAVFRADSKYFPKSDKATTKK